MLVLFQAAGILHPSWEDGRCAGIEFCVGDNGKSQETKPTRSGPGDDKLHEKSH